MNFTTVVCGPDGPDGLGTEESYQKASPTIKPQAGDLRLVRWSLIFGVDVRRGLRRVVSGRSRT